MTTGAHVSLRDGTLLDEPAEEPLRSHEVRVENGIIHVRLNTERPR